MSAKDEELKANFRATRTGYLDGWRGVSIACVLQGHFISLPIELGTFGVALFFCLSGMLMSNLLFVQEQPLAHFYRRRISRVFPTFAFFVIAIFSISSYFGRRFLWPDFWSTLFFLRTYFPYPGIWGSGMPIGHLWSLNIEEHSYIFMSILGVVTFFRRREWYILMLCGTACILTGFVYVKLGTRAPFWGALGTEVAASYLLISAGYSLICHKLRRWVPSWAPIATLLAAVGISQYGTWWMQPIALPFLLAFSVNHLAEAAECFKSLLSIRPLRQFGLWSFSIYLWQQPFYSHKSTFPGGEWSALSCALATGLISFYLIEQPCRTWLNRHWKSWLPMPWKHVRTPPLNSSISDAKIKFRRES